MVLLHPPDQIEYCLVFVQNLEKIGYDGCEEHFGTYIVSGYPLSFDVCDTWVVKNYYMPQTKRSCILQHFVHNAENRRIFESSLRTAIHNTPIHSSFSFLNTVGFIAHDMMRVECGPPAHETIGFSFNVWTGFGWYSYFGTV